MEPTTIILIIIFSVCGLVLVWAFLKGNNIKFKKKEKGPKKTKSKDSKKEEFKEVIPKEKKEKKAVVREAVKEEKAGKVEAPTNKISKITKEDFESNNIEVPKSLGGEDKEAKKIKEKKSSKFDEKALPPIPGLDDGSFKFDDDFLKDDLLDFGFHEDELLGIVGESKSAEDPFKFDENIDLGLGEIPMMDFNNFPPPAPIKNQTRTTGEINPETIEERIEKVFGSNIQAQPGVKEVMVGDILSGNRSRVNRELRERRKKWMK